MRFRVFVLFAPFCLLDLTEACSQQQALSDAGDASSDVAVGDGSDDWGLEGGDSGDGSSADAGDGGCVPNPNFMTDPANCGSCGHDCLGGSCVAAKCQPFVVEYGDAGNLEPAPGAMAADSTGAYWTVYGTPLSSSYYTNGKVRYLSNKGTTIANRATNLASPVGLAVDGVDMFVMTLGTFTTKYVGDGQVLVCPVSGCPSVPTVAASNLGWPKFDLQVAAFGDAGYFVGAGDNTIYKVTDGADAATTFTAAGPATLTADGTFLYYGAPLTKKPFAFGAPITLDSTATGLKQVAVSPSLIIALHAVASPNYDIRACPQPDCAGGLTPFVPSSDGGVYAGAEGLPNSLAADATNLYWIDIYSSNVNVALMMCAQASCIPTTVATLPQAICGYQSIIAVNDVAVFWVCSSGTTSAVMRIAK